MSGEDSKSSGEFGEKIVLNLLKLIGWGNADRNPSIVCLNEEHERKSEKHGLDYVFSFESPLFNHRQEDVLISSKHNKESYPEYPTSIFKKYLYELAEAMDCFPGDPKYSESRISRTIKERKTSGVIFWISSKEDSERDLLNEIKSFRNTDKKVEYGPVYLVDNIRANFLFRAISYAKNLYGEYNFFYPPTGYNNTDPYVKSDYGSKLPVQCINTNILPIRVEINKSGPALLLFVNEKFSENSLRRIMGFTQRLTHSWVKVIILYYDYLELEHRNAVQTTKRLFEEKFIDTVDVRSFRDTISILGEE